MKTTFKDHFVTATVSAIVALQAWTLQQVVQLKVHVAELAVRIDTPATHIAKN